MRILYITQYYPPEVGAGAVRSEAMVRNLIKDGWEVDVITEIPNYPTGKTHPKYGKDWAYRQKNGPLTIHRIWVWANQRRNIGEQLLFFLTFMVSSFLYLLFREKDYDIIYCTSPPIFAAISGLMISKISGAKFVFEVRDLWPDSAVDQKSLQSKSFFIRMGRVLEKWLYHSADLIIPVTKESKKIIETKSNGTPTQVITNGVDLSLFRHINSQDLKLDEPYNHNKFRVGYVGSLGVIHDLETFVKAAKICEKDKSIEFVIVGDGGRNNKLHKLIDEYNSKNIVWLGLKKHQKVPHYISSFDLALNPINDSKAFKSIVTVKFYEYLACEVPVISSGRGAIDHISKLSGSAITVPPGDFEALAEVIMELKNNSQKRNELSQNARSFVAEKFSRENLALKLSQALKKLIS